MEAFAIMHLGTKNFMPARMGKHQAGGWSHWEPSDEPGKDYGGYDAHPRIFFTLKAAQNACAAWAHGPWKKEAHDSGNYFDGPEYTEEVVPTEPRVPRSRDQLAIVPLEILGI